MMVKTGLYLAVIFSLLTAQGLFESAQTESSGKLSTSGPQESLNFSGYIKGAVFGGRNLDKETEIKAAYGEVSLKLDARKADIGRAFAEIRLRPGFENDAAIFLPDVREAWVTTSPGPLDITLGKKIIAWGRADGINPTNSVTPMNPTAFSSDYDDTRLGNIIAQSSFSKGFLRLEGIWIPVYVPDILTVSGADLPEGIKIVDPSYPGPELDKSGFAMRCDITLPAVDGSISYFNGYETQPGFDYEFNMNGVFLKPSAYRVHTAGADFSTVAASFGIRGEAALTIPFDKPHDVKYVPFRHASYVFGVDRSIGDWSFLFQYSGVYVIGFEEIEKPNPFDPLYQSSISAFMLAMSDAEMRRINRLFTGTADRTSHAVTGRIGWSGLHETLRLELAGLYNFTTEEYVVNPSASYDIADEFTLTLGGRYLRGPDGSLNDLVDDMLSHAYAELKFSF